MRVVLWTQCVNCFLAMLVLMFFVARRSVEFDTVSFFAGVTFTLFLVLGFLALCYPPRKDEP